MSKKNLVKFRYLDFVEIIKEGFYKGATGRLISESPTSNPIFKKYIITLVGNVNIEVKDEEIKKIDKIKDLEK